MNDEPEKPGNAVLGIPGFQKAGKGKKLVLSFEFWVLSNRKW